jgi:hypothetical protein
MLNKPGAAGADAEHIVDYSRATAPISPWF